MSLIAVLKETNVIKRRVTTLWQTLLLMPRRFQQNKKIVTIFLGTDLYVSNTVVPLGQKRLNNSADLYLANSTKQTKCKLFR